VAVTKGFGADAIAAAAAAGCTAIGENYAQELLSKRAAVETAGVDVHFIGRLQSNKIRALSSIVTLWESVDRPTVVTELARRCPGGRILVQVGGTDEPTKGGCAPDDVPALVERAVDGGLRVEGLMTIGPLEGGPEAARPVFRIVRRLVDELGLARCSMGMSGDLEVAVEEGATEVRLGTALFGPRA
jgi:pyridoxal phosphate enzyme (YggS family)